MRKREFTLAVFDSLTAADEANRKSNRELTGVERVRMLTAIVGGGSGKSESRLSGTYRVIHIPRR